jgi:hypothetical protein
MFAILRESSGKDLERTLESGNKAKSHRINGSCDLIRTHNPKVVSSNLPPPTMGAYEANPLSALLIYSYELSRNNSSA